ncbi:ubiquitin-conjugating enzyme/RWD-like protein [Lipomyces doorenjongii]|uniref:ubiquitin-conjugating enzyme/RWD-like protein n=1 Tax=Lipomyces doorenjongii TaxID=383834 RepID=UPI0034CFFC83
MDSQNTTPTTISSHKMQDAPTAMADSHSVTKRLQSELMQLMMSNVPGISAFPVSDSNLCQWTGTISGPEGTHINGYKFYEGLTYKISMTFPPNYPYHAPVIRFVSPMWHPNVDMSGNICLDILKEKWSAIYNVQTILLSLQSLLGEPNNASPLNAQAADLWDGNPAEYKRLMMTHYKDIGEINDE